VVKRTIALDWSTLKTGTDTLMIVALRRPLPNRGRSTFSPAMLLNTRAPSLTHSKPSSSAELSRASVARDPREEHDRPTRDASNDYRR
jgi:hypothetical protein